MKIKPAGALVDAIAVEAVLQIHDSLTFAVKGNFLCRVNYFYHTRLGKCVENRLRDIHIRQVQ